jgi:hypothetical protein
MSEEAKSEEDKPRAKPQRVMPPVSTATGGLMPGIDPTKLARIVEEMGDLERMERLKRDFRD